MKIIVAGGRYVRLSAAHMRLLNTLNITELVSDGCRGIDIDAESWARKRRVPIKSFLPQWGAYGKAAGPLQNGEMTEYADAAVLLPGGTRSMRREAERRGLVVYNLDRTLERA